MKRIIAICCAVLLVAACVEPIQPYTGPVLNEPEDGAPVTLTFSLPPMTKAAMAHDPAISTIHVAVFNQAGVLKQFEQATLTHPTNEVLSGVSENNPTYSVQVHMSAAKRILHFIADSPVATFDQLVALAGTSGEDAVLNALTTTDGEAAYWQRVELDRIDAYTYKGGVYRCPDGTTRGTEGANSYTYVINNQTITVNAGDYIKRDGQKVLDGTGYFQSDYVAGEVANIPLVRNFAEIKVTDNPNSNFHPVKFALVNVPNAGFVAPFDTKKDEFAKAYIGKESLVHSDVAATNYPGSLVGDINTDMPAAEAFIPISKTAYMYERPLPNTQEPSTCILVAGEYNVDGAKKDTEGNTWFKIEIADPSGQYFPIYRGISYEIKIGTIDGSLGYGSAKEAFDDYPIGDISDMTSTATLESINDGKGTTLWVEYIDYVATQAEEKTLYYTMYYQPSGSTTPQYLLNDIELSVTHPYEDPSRAAIVGEVTVEDGVFTTGTPDANKQWKKATVPLAAVGQSTKYSTLTVTGTTPAAAGGRKISRKVNYEVMGVRQFQYFRATSLTSEAKGQQTRLDIGLPADLGFSLFPLQLMIEAQNQSYASEGHLPVEYGNSLFVEDAKGQFYYVMTIEYEDYLDRVRRQGIPEYRLFFTTTRTGTADASNATTFAIRDKVKLGRTTPYFEKARCEVTVGGDIFEFSKTDMTVAASRTQVLFHVRSSSAGTWSLQSDNSAVEISPSTGTGSQLVTVTLPENTSTTATNTYTITGSLTGFGPATLVIKQSPVTVLETETVDIEVNYQTFNTAFVYNGRFKDYPYNLHMNFDGGYQRYDNYVSLNNGAVSGILVSAANIQEIVITWQDSSHQSTGSHINHIHGTTTSLVDATSGNPRTTTWKGNADAVSIRFGGLSGNYNYRITHLKITYSHPQSTTP